MRPGDTFVGFDFAGHLWMVLSEVTEDGRVAVANLTKHEPGRRRNCDSACEVVQPGDHPILTHASCIYRASPELTDAGMLQKNIQTGAFPARDPLREDVLARIQEAVRTSDRTPREVRAAIAATG